MLCQFVFAPIKDFNKAMHNQFGDAMKGNAVGSGQSKERANSALAGRHPFALRGA
jgi:hypothetical protein